MTFTHKEQGYLERPYLADEYHTPAVIAQGGMQANFSIADGKKPVGMQALFSLEDYIGMEMIVTNIAHWQRGYLMAGYLQDDYMKKIIIAQGGQQASFYMIDKTKSLGFQANAYIVDNRKSVGMQSLFSIVDATKPIGMQGDFRNVKALAMQFLAALYNNSNLRILWEFPSRGLPVSEGGSGGLNWVANNTKYSATNDFTVNNLNTDIIEQYWRSENAAVTGIHLDCDTEKSQGVFLDTFAMLGHNLSRSATVYLLGANVADFSTIGVTIPIQIINDDNSYYIAENIPTQAYRYWRISIDDSANADGFIRVGTVVFGASFTFQQECFVDELKFQLKDFADTINTEGHTNVSNSRAQKKNLKLDFRYLDSNMNNFETLRDIFKYARTVLKCLWIPTPSYQDQNITSRFALYGKLSQVPEETHMNKGPENDYVTFNIEVDESL